MDNDVKIKQLINRWFKENKFLFTLIDDYNSKFISFVHSIVISYLQKNNLLNLDDDDLLYGHIRFILGNTYKEEISAFNIPKKK